MSTFGEITVAIPAHPARVVNGMPDRAVREILAGSLHGRPGHDQQPHA